MLPGYFAQQVAPLYLQRVVPFCRTLTTTTDWQTSLLVEIDGYVLGELREAYPRVQRHRGPQKRLCRRRAAASPGAPCGARLRSRRSRGPWAHNLWRGGNSSDKSIHSLCGVRSRLSTSFKCGKKWKECDRRCVK